MSFDALLHILHIIIVAISKVAGRGLCERSSAKCIIHLMQYAYLWQVLTTVKDGVWTDYFERPGHIDSIYEFRVEGNKMTLASDALCI